MREIEVLFTDGYFRIVRDNQSSSAYVQHQHTTAPTRKLPFSEGLWVYCWFNEVFRADVGGGMRCSSCETRVPLKMQGLIILMRWKK